MHLDLANLNLFMLYNNKYTLNIIHLVLTTNKNHWRIGYIYYLWVDRLGNQILLSTVLDATFIITKVK